MAARVREHAREQQVVAERAQCLAQVVLGRDQPGNARFHGLGQADPEVESERPRDLVGEKSAHAPMRRIGAPDQFAGEPTERTHVVSVRRAGLPDRRLRGERAHHRLPRERVFERNVALDVREARLVAQHLLDRDRVFPVRAELGPHRCNRCRRVEQRSLDQQVRAHTGDALRRRVHEHDRVCTPRRAGAGVGEAAPEVDDGTAVGVHAHGRADFAALVEVERERVEHGLELGFDPAVDHGRVT